MQFFPQIKLQDLNLISVVDEVDHGVISVLVDHLASVNLIIRGVLYRIVPPPDMERMLKNIR